MEIVCTLADVLKQRGWTNRRLAQETGLTANTISNVARASSLVSLLSLAKICQVLELKPGDMLQWRER